MPQAPALPPVASARRIRRPGLVPGDARPWPPVNDATRPCRPTGHRPHPLLLALVLAVLVLAAVAPATAADDRTLSGPPDATILQRGRDGLAEVAFVLTPGSLPARVRLTGKDATQGSPAASRVLDLPPGQTQGVFPGVPAGLYDLCLEGAAASCRRIGVGEVFLVAGQSNAVSQPTPASPGISATGRVAVSAHHGDAPGHEGEVPDIETMLLPTSGHPAPAGACWLRLGDLLAEKYQVPVAFVIVARSATSTDCWNPEKGACWELAAKALSSRTFRAVLWHQGESDAMGGASMEHSLANMRAMIEASRRLQPGLPWIVARNSLANDIPYAEQPIRRAQEALIASGQVCPGPDTDVIRDHPGWVGVADFGGEGVSRHGELWFPFVDALLASGVCGGQERP